jgi:hypothetical protein
VNPRDAGIKPDGLERESALELAERVEVVRQVNHLTEV